MDWYVVDRGLAPLFTGAPRLVGDGFWVPASEPVALAPLLDAALADEEERERYEGTFEAWPGNVEEVLGASEAQMESVLSCFWSSGPGMSSADGLQLVGV